MVLVGFYVLYAIQNVFDSTFYGLGKTNYMLFESVVTNTIYYGIAFILYATNVWTPSLIGIALLFGIGNAFDSIVSLVAYSFLLKKEKINILSVPSNFLAVCKLQSNSGFTSSLKIQVTLSIRISNKENNIKDK
jgi:Na+-driven multidrug efflux pump